MRGFNINKSRIGGEWTKRIKAERAAGESFGLVVEVVDAAHDSVHIGVGAAFRVCVDVPRVKRAIPVRHQLKFAPGRTE